MRSTLYTDRKSGYDVLLVEVDLDSSGKTTLVGAAYDPLRTNVPTPFSSSCRHCTSGMLHRELPIQVKRLVQMLLSRRRAGYLPHHHAPIYDYLVPANSSPYRLRHWQTSKISRAEAVRDDGRSLGASRDADGETTFTGNVTAEQSRIAGRCLRFVLSARPALDSLTKAVLVSLTTNLPQNQHWHANPCNAVPWKEIFQQYERERGA